MTPFSEESLRPKEQYQGVHKTLLVNPFAARATDYFRFLN